MNGDFTPRRGSRVRRSLPLITTASSLSMIYVAATNSPVFTDFMRAIGAREMHFGLIGGIPLVMLSAQFIGALVANHVHRRKPLFVILALAGRILYLPIAFLPLIFPGARAEAMVMALIGLMGLNSALSNMTGPPWLAWMADLVPHGVLNRYWGLRQRAMHLTWTFSFVGIVLFTCLTGWPAMRIFPILAVVGTLAAITDVLLFVGVHEPPNRILPHQPVLDMLLAPLRNPGYRPFIVFSCAWSFTGMFSAAFMQLYVLKVLRLPMWQTTLIWCFLGIGVALSSRRWGRLADRHGHRPILLFCMFVKPLILVAFLIITPRTAFCILSVAFLVDSMWNSAVMVSSNGYMLKMAPVENRSMYIAAITGLAGICGGLGALVGGWFLEHFAGFSAPFMGWTWNNYQLLFVVNIFMRLACLPLVLRIREPTSSSAGTVVKALWGIRAMRLVLFPIGVYWLWNRRPSEHAGVGPDDVV